MNVTPSKKTKPRHKPSAAFLRRNAAFKAATKAEKRVLIAKDVLAQLKAEKIVPSPGDWVRMYVATVPDGSLDVCTITENPVKKGVECHCCGLGALMLSEIRHTNELTVGDLRVCRPYSAAPVSVVIGRGDSGDRLEKYFSSGHLQLIEIAFEEGRGAHSVFTSQDYEAKMFALGKKPEERLRLIMKNIVKNGGTFAPHKKR
jgi:hypothetical protein